MSGPPLVQEILSKLGISEQSAHKFKFGGIVGKIALVALGGFIAAIGVAKYTSGLIQAICILAVLATTLLVIWWILRYAEKHPVSATLEGAEIILWQQHQLVLAAKGLAELPESPVIPNPEGAPPQVEPSEESDR